MTATPATEIQLSSDWKDLVTRRLRPASREYLKHKKAHPRRWQQRPNDVYL